MSNFKLQTPVVLLIFNRRDTTKKVFDAISQAQPKQLMVIGDGPRQDHPQDIEKCRTTREIIEQVDWDCQVLTNYAEQNLGCQKRVSSGLDWVFDRVEEAIILEDDCLPDPTFFRFCQELLDDYRHDRRIGAISGQNVQFGRQRTAYSYYFSRYNHCWGWASWRRAWQDFDFEMKLWPQVRDGGWLQDILGDPKAVKEWQRLFQLTYDGYFNSWAYRWTFACWIQSYLSILSNVNLVSNIGFGQEGTNTTKKTSRFASMPTQQLTFPLQHPPFIVQDTQADHFTQKTLYNRSLTKRAKVKIKKFLDSTKKSTV